MGDPPVCVLLFPKVYWYWKISQDAWHAAPFFQKAGLLFRPRERGSGTTRSVVEGAAEVPRVRAVANGEFKRLAQSFKRSWRSLRGRAPPPPFGRSPSPRCRRGG